MRTELKSNLSYNRTLLILSALCILSGIVSIFVGELAIPLTTAFYAAVLVFEVGKKRLFSIALSVLMVIINLLSVFIFNSGISLWSIATVICAALVSLAYVRNYSKFDFSLALTGVIAFFIVASMLIAGMINAGSFDVSAAIDFYQQIISQVRTESANLIIDLYNDIYREAANGAITMSDALEIVDMMLNTLVSVLIIASFAIGGLCFKFFGFVLGKCLEDKECIRVWRFDPPTLYGHVYMVLMIAQFVASFSDGVVPMVIANLYLIFAWIYAYVGFNTVHKIFAGKKRPFVITLIIVGFMLLFSSLAIQVLALLGALYTTRRPRTGNDNL